MDFFRDKKKKLLLSHIIHYTKKTKKGSNRACESSPKISTLYLSDIVTTSYPFPEHHLP